MSNTEFTAMGRQERIEYLEERVKNYKKVICYLEDDNRDLKQELNELERKIRWNLGVILINVFIILCLFLIAIN